MLTGSNLHNSTWPYSIHTVTNMAMAAKYAKNTPHTKFKPEKYIYLQVFDVAESVGRLKNSIRGQGHQ